jgi:regulator of protease activity HflC (stomatin/prohibitin superfamily)
MEQNPAKFLIGAIVVGLAAIFGLIVLFGSWTTVSSQEVGVITRFSAVHKIVGEGFHFKVPMIDGVDTINVAEQKSEFNTQAYSKDGQVIDLGVTVTYLVNRGDAERIYREVKNDYQNIYLNPVITPSAEEVVTRFTAKDLIEKKAEWSAEVKRLIVERLDGRGLTVKSIEISKFDFDDSYEQAIRNKQVQEQEALAQANITSQEEEKKKQEIFKAEALAEKTRLEAQALASQQGSKVIDKIMAEAALKAAERWDGKACVNNCYGDGIQAPIQFMNMTK